MKIAIDLGHGVGCDRGAEGFIKEEDIINEVGSLVINKLRALGNEVLTVRPSSASSVGNSLKQRVNASNNFNADLFICIHANAGGGQGTEVFTYNGKELKQARNILNNLVALGFRNRGIKSESLYVINHTNAESLLLEICFVDTQSDIDLYHSLGDEKIADAIVKGIVGQTVAISPTTNTQPIAQEVKSSIQKAKEFVGGRCLELQQKLNRAFGDIYGRISEDNDFGQLTYEALGVAQTSLGITCDYLAGEKTFAKLNEVIKATSSQTQGNNKVLSLQRICNQILGSGLVEDGLWGNLTDLSVKNLPLCGVNYTQPILTKWIQSILGISCDGVFLYETERYLKEFQNTHNLKNDGICGFNSYKALSLS